MVEVLRVDFIRCRKLSKEEKYLPLPDKNEGFYKGDGYYYCHLNLNDLTELFNGGLSVGLFTNNIYDWDK